MKRNKKTWRFKTVEAFNLENQLNMTRVEKIYLSFLLYNFLEGEIKQGNLLCDVEIDQLDSFYIKNKLKCLYFDIPPSLKYI